MSLRKTVNQVGALIFVAIIGWYFIAIKTEMNSVDHFCEEMTPGLDVHLIADIAAKYDVGSPTVRDKGSVDKKTLGVKDTKKDDGWFFAVAAPMTVGEHACGVYHDYHVVTSHWLSR